MRIVSLLPSATEILFALGAGDQISGLTYECDFPPAARQLPILVHSALSSGLTPLEIDAAVRAASAQGSSLYLVDWKALSDAAPELVLTQDLCRVCAISEPTVARQLAELPAQPTLLSLSPHTLTEALDDILRIGRAVDREAQAAALLSDLRRRIESLRAPLDARPRPRVLCVEWLDPLFQGGHWVPELVLLAGGEPVLAKPGGKSITLDWQQALDTAPEVIVFMPCGYDLAQTQAQLAAWQPPPGWAETPAVRNGRVYAVDGNAYFSRPGPRLVDGLAILAAILREEPFDTLPAASVAQVSADVFTLPRH